MQKDFLRFRGITFLIVSLLLFSLVSTSVFALEDTTNQWEDHSVALSFTYRDIAVDDQGTYVVVGNDGKIQTSTDTLNWISAESVTRETLFGCTWGNDVFVAVGSRTIMYSDDGNEWTLALNNEEILFKDVTYGDYGFVAVGAEPNLNSQDDIRYIYHSVDGINWKEVLVYEGSFDWRKIDYLNSTYIAYDNPEDELAYSKDGENWTIVKANTPINSSRLIWDGYRYISIGSDMTFNFEDLTFATIPIIATSTNLLDWEKIEHNINDGVYLSDVVYFDGAYVMTCSVDDSYLFLYSKDFEYWDVFINEYFGSLSSSIVNNDKLTFVGPNGTIINVTDGKWNSTQAYNSHITKVIYGESYLATGHDGRFYKSQDGKTWTQYSSGIEFLVKDIVWTGNKYVVLRKVYDSESKTYVNSQIFSSVDGEEWVLESEIDNKNISVLRYCNNKYFALGMDGEIFWSTDAKNWEQAESPTEYWLKDIEWFKGKYFIVGMFGTILTSEDGITWEDHSLEYKNDLNDIATNGESLQIVGDWMRSYNTKDGKNWSKNPEYDSINFEKVIWDGSDYVIFAYGGKYYKTKDGVKLREFETDMYSDVSTVCWNGMRYIVAGRDGAIASHTPKEFIKVIVDNKSVFLNRAPHKVNDTIMIPLKAVFERVGANVFWNNRTNSAFIVKDDIAIHFQIDSVSASVNGVEKIMTSPAINVEGDTLVPLEFVVEELGMTFEWDEDTNTIIIKN